MKNKEERKYIKEAIRLVELLKKGHELCLDNLLDILKHADKVIKNTNVAKKHIEKNIE